VSCVDSLWADHGPLDSSCGPSSSV